MYRLLKIIFLFVFTIAALISCNQNKKPIKNTALNIQELVQIINSKDSVQLKKRINKNNVNSKDSSGVTLLSRAIITKDSNLVKILIDKGANPNITNRTKTKSTPLMMCANFNMIKTAEYLIDKGANIDTPDANGDPVINWSAYMGEYDFTKMLLDKGALTNQKSIHSDNAISVALKEWQDSIVDLFIKYDKGIYATEKELIPLIDAIKNNDIHYLQKNLNTNNSNTKDPATNSLLILAASKGYLDIVKLLVQKEADINYVNTAGHSALNKAVFFNHNTVAKYLISQGADVNKANERFMLPPLVAAARANNLELGKILLDKGADINTINSIDRFTPIVWAALYDNIDFVKLLLKYNPDLSIQSKYDNQDIFQMTRNAKILDILKTYKNK